MKYHSIMCRQLLGLMISPKAIQKISFVITPLVFVAAFLLLSHRVAANNITWDGGGTTNNWSEAANWSGDVVPGSSDTAIFNGTSTKNATIDVSINVQGIQINTGYTNTGPGTGTITQAGSSTVTIGGSGFTQSSGTFTGGSGDIDINGNFAFSGGTFTASSGSTFFGGQFGSDLPGGTFNHNGGTVVFDGNSVDSRANPAVTLNNLIVNKPGGNFFTLGGTLVVTSTLTLSDGVFLSGGPIEAQGVVNVDAAFDGGGGQLAITGANTRTLTFNAGATLLPTTLNAPNATVQTLGSGAINWPSLTLQAGTIQQGSVGFIFTGAYNQSGGIFSIFNGGSGNIDAKTTFNLTGGTFNSTTGTLFIGASFIHDVGGAFNHNNGTVTFDATLTSSLQANLGAENFNNVNFNDANGQLRTVFGGPVVVLGALVFNDGRVDGNIIEGRAAVTIGANFDGGGVSLTYSGSADQTFTNNGGANPTGTWTVDKSARAVTLASDLTLQTGQALNITQGVLDQGASFNLTAGPITVGSAGRLQNRGIGDLTLRGNVTNNGIINFNGGGIANCGDPDSILIRSLPDMTVRTWAGSGSFSMQDVDVKDQMVSTIPPTPGVITAFSSTDSGNNTNWTFNAGCNPTEVTLESFTATGYEDGQVLLQWHTGFEVDNLGFNVYRQEAGGQTRLNRSMIAGSALIAGPGTRLTAGHFYSWKDSLLKGKQATQYWLESVDLHGQGEWHGPVAIQKAEGSRQKADADQQALTLGEIGNGEERDTCSALEAKAQTSKMTLESLQSQATLAAQAAVKIAVRGEGWYRVTQPELAAAGFDTKVNPRLLQVFVDGNRLPILVQGEQDGSFDAGDSVEFYGIGIETPFTGSRVYWLVAGDQPGLRINQAKSEGTPSPSRSFTYTVDRRDRNIYFSGLRNGEKENFFGAVVSHNTVDQELTLVHLAQADSAQAQLEIGLQGVTFGDHHVGVRLNGLPVGELTFHGQAQGSARFAVANSILREGANTVQLTPLSGESDISLVDFLRVSYQHSYTADSDALKVTATGNQLVTIDGFRSKSVRVFDVTDSKSPEELLGEVKQERSGYAVTVGSRGQGQRELVAFTTEQRPASLSLNLSSNLRAGSADFIVVTRREFADAVRPLVALRQKQGLSVSLVDIEDIYDEFSFGQKSPYAMRDFLAYAKSLWKKKPRFVLFAGDASFDPKNYLGFGDSDLVPTKLIDTDFMETSSDDWLSDFNGDGIADIATGRLPARTVEELTRMVAKIINYEQGALSDEALLVADANEGFDFEQASAELRSLIPDNLRITQVNRGRVDAEMARNSLFEALYRRQFLVNYVGHGSVNQWRGNLLTNDDALALRNDHLPMFVMMTCLNGYFQDPALDSLGESLLKAERGGAVAVWASSGMTMPTDQALVNQELYRLLFSRVPGITIGEAVIRAKSSSSSSDVRRTWILLGDPAMKLK